MKNIFYSLIFVFMTVAANAAEISVSIDMASYNGPSFTNVMMNGGFKGWGDAISLTTDDDSLVWTATVTMNEGTNDYRFEVGGGEVGWNAEWEGKTSAGDCFVSPNDGAQTNMRWIEVAADSTLPTFCWETCTSCSVEEPTTGEVTLTIDMASYQGPSFTSVLINGGFKGWGDAISLTTDDDSIVWTTTVTMNVGSNDYRFEIAGGEVGWDSEWEGETSVGECFVSPYDSTQTNMRWVEISGDVELETVCWETCTSCTSYSEMYAKFEETTFTINRNNELVVIGAIENFEHANIRIYDTRGVLVKSYANVNLLTEVVSVNDLRSGAYILSVISDGIALNRKIIK